MRVSRDGPRMVTWTDFRAFRRGLGARRTLNESAPHLSLILLAVLAGAVLVPDAGAARRTVSTEAGFHAAVEQMRASGGIITLRAGRYGYLRVGPRAGRWLTIRARPRAVTRYVEVHGARRVKLVDLDVVTFKGRHALLDIDRSRQVNVLRARVRGRNGLRARVSVTSSRGVAVRDSTFRRTRWVSLRSIGSSRVTVEGNRFVDCYGCDFLLVKATNDLVVRGNTFDRALPGLCGVEGSCNHQDLAQMTGGRRWLIEGNRFGVAYNGAAQLYITGYGPTDDVVIRGNTFLRDDPLAPGFAPWTGVVIGQPTGWLGLPRNVRIEGNTILSGYPRPHGHWIGVANSIILTEQYAALPPGERPVVTGNVLATTTHPELLCGVAREATGNVTESGDPVCY